MFLYSLPLRTSFFFPLSIKRVTYSVVRGFIFKLPFFSTFLSFVLPAVQVQLFKVTSYVTSFSQLILRSSRSILPLIIDPEDPDPRIDLYSECDEIFFFFLFLLI